MQTDLGGLRSNEHGGVHLETMAASKHRIRRLQSEIARLVARAIQKYWMRARSRRVLFIDDTIPHISLGAGFPRSNLILSEMVQMGLAVTLFSANPFFEKWTLLYADISPKVEVVLGEGSANLARFLAARAGYYKLLFVSRPHNMRAVKQILRENSQGLQGVKIIYDAEALFAYREIHRLKTEGRPMPSDQAERLIDEEVSLADGCDAVVSVSKKESRAFLARGVQRVVTLGHAVKVSPTPNTFQQRAGILFVGAVLGQNSPNYDALLWFARDVFPIIRERIKGDVQLVVAGAGTEEVKEVLNDDKIRILGRVNDLRPLYDRARLFVAPVRFAAGIPLRIYEAASHGIAVVTTPLLAEQLEWRDGVDLLAAADASGFADACVNLYRDEKLWSILRSNALGRVKTDCSREIFSAKLKDLMHSTLDEPSSLMI